MANKLKQEDLVLNIIVNGNKAQSEIGKVSRSLQDATAKSKAMQAEQRQLERQGKENTQRYQQLTQEIQRNNAVIQQQKARLSELNQSLKLEDQTVKQLNTSLRRLRQLRDQSVPNSAQWQQYNQQVVAVTHRLEQLQRQGQHTAGVLTRMGNGVRNFFSTTVGGLASLAALAMGVRKGTDEFTKFDDKIADVMKTTNGAKQEVMGLNAELEKLNTRTSQEDLLGLARIGGKLGITDMDELRGFVSSTNQLVVALNEDLGGNVEETVNAVGKLVEIFGVADMFGMESGLLKVGSAINELGMASTANEGYMVEFSRRMAGVAPLAGITVQEILGLGATLDQLGQTSEVSSTALSKLFLKLSSDAASFAKYAGMEVNAFKDLLEKDFMAAFTKVLHGVKDNANGINELAATLGDLGLDGGRVIGVLGSLANNTHILTDQINLANTAFEKGTSLTDEYNIKNSTAAAELEKARKEVTKFWRELGEKLWPVITSGNNLLVIFLQTIITLITFTTKYWSVIVPLTVALVTYYTTVQLVAKWEAITTALMVAKRTTLIVLNGLYALLTGNLGRAAAAQRLLNIQMLLNPYAAAAALVLGLAVALATFSKRLTAAEFSQKALNEAEKDAERISQSQTSAIERYTKVLREENRTRDEKLAAVKSLRDIMPGVLDQYTDEEILAGKATKAINEQTKAIILQAKIRARQEKIQELERQRMEAGDFGFWDKVTVGAAGLLGQGNAIRTAANITVSKIGNIETAINDLTEGILDAQGELNKLYGAKPTVNPTNGEPIAPSGDPKAAAKARAAASRARTAELEAAKKSYEEQLQAEGLFRKDRREMTTEELEKLLEIESSYQQKVDDINKKYQHSATETTKVAESELTKREIAEKKYRDKLLDPRDPKYVQEQEQHQERLKQAGLHGKERETLTADQLKALERLEAIHTANIGKIDSEAMKKGIQERQNAYQDELTDLRIRNNEELAQVRTLEQAKAKLSATLTPEALRQIKTLNEAKRLLQSQYQQQEADLTRKHLEGLRTLLKSVLDTGEWQGIDLADKVLSPEERKVLEDALRSVGELISKILNPDKTDLFEDDAKKIDILGMSMSDWEKLFANLEAGKLGVQDVAHALLAMNQIWAQYNAFVSAGEERQLQEYEEANKQKKESLKKRLDAGTISQETYNKQVEKLDKELDKKRARMEYDQAKRERNIAISNAIANTAVAVTKVLAQGGIAGIVLAAVVGALGALQLATIMKQPLPSLSGREGGGYLVRRSQDGKTFNAAYDPDKRGYVHRPTVIAGEDGSEFVANRQAVENPSIKPILDVIDTAQRNGTISTLSLEKVLPRGREIRASLPGRQGGGTVSVAPAASASSAELSAINDTIDRANKTMDRLEKTIASGIKAEVALLGKNGFYEKDAEYKSIQKDANL